MYMLKLLLSIEVKIYSKVINQTAVSISCNYANQLQHYVVERTLNQLKLAIMVSSAFERSNPRNYTSQVLVGIEKSLSLSLKKFKISWTYEKLYILTKELSSIRKLTSTLNKPNFRGCSRTRI